MRWWFALSLAALASCDWPGVSSNSGLSGGSHVEDNSGDLGSSCGTDVRCQQGLSCVTQAPGGLCTHSCNSDEDCSGGACVYIANWGGLLCLKGCLGDVTCRTDWACVSSGSANVCAQDYGTSPDAG